MLLHGHWAIIWCAFGVAWLNSKGVGCFKVDVFPHCFAVFCAVCMQAMTHSAAYVPSQQAVKLAVVRPGFVEQCWFGLFLVHQR